VPPRLSATERIRAQIDELFASQQDLGQVLEQVARLSVRLVIQAALEAEVSEFLGREHYARCERERAGYRNGHAELTVKTTAGPVVLERPKLRGTSQPFASRLLGKGVSRTNALEALVISGFVRGLSTHDVEAALGEVLGPEAALSKSTVSRICQAITDEFDAWKTRDLGGIELEYLFLDGSHFRMHPGAPAEPVLAAWAITTQGSPVLLALAPGAHEGHDPWAGFLGDVVARGLRAPLLVITDGAPGLIGAVEVVFPQSLGQRCLVHRARNLLARVPPTPRTRSRPRSGRSSTTSPPTLASWRSMRRAAAPRRSLTATASATRRRSPVCWIACPSSPRSCASRVSTGKGSATPT
jgi:putative transposase